MSTTPFLDHTHIQNALCTGTGKGVRLALLDTGVEESHPDLTHAVAKSYELIQRGRGYECVPAKGSDTIGHGSACASIIKHLAPEVELHSIKVFGANARLGADALAFAIRWCNDNDIDIINASLGTVDARSEKILSAASDKAFYHGTIIVAAANNSGLTAYPANFSSVLAVNSQNFSNPLDFKYLPGLPVELESNGIYIKAPNPQGGHKLYTGTSFACPHISGIVARLLSVYPGLQPFEVRTLLWHLGGSI